MSGPKKSALRDPINSDDKRCNAYISFEGIHICFIVVFVICLDIVGFGSARWSSPERCKLFDSKSGVVSELPRMNVARTRRPGVVAIQRGTTHRIYVFGGFDDETDGLDSCEYIDIGESNWILLGKKMASPRSATCAVLLDHNTVVICGGGHNPYERGGLVSCEVFDLTTHTFSPFPDMLESRYGHSGVHYDGTIVVIAGCERMKTCEQFDPVTFRWAPFPPLREGRHYFGAAVVDGKIYVAGGYTVEVYDGSAWSVATYLYCHSCKAVALEGRLVVIRGGDDHFLTASDTFDTATHEWSSRYGKGELTGGYINIVSF